MTERLPIYTLLFGCGLFGAVIFLELTSNPGGGKMAIAVPKRPAPVLAAAAPQRKEALDKLVTVILARPLFSPTRRPAADSGGGANPDVALADARLTGIITQEKLRLAIFAIRGKKPLALSVGDSVSGWRIESISPKAIALRGPGGLRTVEPKPDRGLARMPLPASFPVPQPGPRPGFAPAVAKGPPRPPFAHPVPIRRGAPPWH